MILLVEDHANLAQEIRAYLVHEGFKVCAVSSGCEALRLARERPWTAILLDLSLPDIDGTEVCRQLRREGCDTPIIMVTARGLRGQVVAGLDCGADDYLVKPFGLNELAARIRAVVRRTGTTKEPRILVGEVMIDTNSRKAYRSGEEVHLAPREYALLEFLARHRGVPQDRVTLIEQVWGEPESLLFSQTVDVHVAYIRRKLGAAVIKTVPGVGYMVPDE